MGIVRFIWLRFLVRFSRALSYDVGVYSLRSPMISFGDITGQSLQRLCRDCTKTAQSYCNLHDIRSKIARCPCDVNAGSLRLSQEPTIKLLSKFLWCPHDQRAVPVRGSCDQPAMYLRATGSRFFSKFSRVRS